MVCADDLSFWTRNFPAWPADRSVFDAGRHFLRRAFVHGASADRTKIRHGIRASAGDYPGVYATASARILPVFHLAAFQTHTGKRHSEARTFARKRALARQPESPRILERGREGSPLFPGRNISVARRRRLALFRRQRLERLGHSNLRQFLVEHRASNCHRISRRGKMFDPCAASQPDGYYHDHFQSDCDKLENEDRKSTRLNSSHTVISYAVFCL